MNHNRPNNFQKREETGEGEERKMVTRLVKQGEITVEEGGRGGREEGKKGGGVVKVGTDEKEVGEVVPLSVHFENLFCCCCW